MVTSTDDNVLRQDMPSALVKVESAAKLLEEAAKMSQVRIEFRQYYLDCFWDRPGLIVKKSKSLSYARLL